MTDPCKICLLVYGMEKPPKNSICGNRNFLVILDVIPDGERHILIIPKTHCSSLLEMVNEKDAKEDFNDIIAKALNYIKQELGVTDLAMKRITGGHDYLMLIIPK